ncbi:hypothetical protein F0562_014078 [Nyssa sinensis]|uniref:Retrovirus-related Pol polyprotein from transposon TNT 1-94-like beta-barrel domain-containing protein n=1 Tax=Nyssa sinensis TaxID=561372 RepID=A0A5J4ZQW5_9ASTE|nr:hypothetical protein F0562_014078 [Nyssa sinensis]
MEGGPSIMIKLNNMNWLIWKPKLEDILYCKDLYEPIERDTAKPKDMDDEKWKRLNRKTIGNIRQWLDDSVFSHVSNETDAQVLWKKLEARYEQKTATSKAFLIRKLVNMKFKEGSSSLFNEETTRKLAGTDNAQALVSENRKREQKEENNNQKKNEEKNTIATFEGDEVMVLSCGKEECLHVGNEIEWVVDTSASYHATYNKEFFTSYKVRDFGTVKMGNTSHSKIVGIGNVCIHTSVGCTMTLRDVRHVPDLRLNLISGIALDREGYVNHFGNGIWKLTKGSLVVARGKACCTLYKTNLKMCRDRVELH